MPVGQKNHLLSVFPVQLHADKVGHFFGFALFAWSLRGALEVRQSWVVIVVAACLAALTEGLQHFADGRVPLLLDVLIDTAGAAVGLGAALLAFPRPPQP